MHRDYTQVTGCQISGPSNVAPDNASWFGWAGATSLAASAA